MADGEGSWQWVPHPIPAPSASAEQPGPSSEQPGPSAEQPRPSDAATPVDWESCPGTDVSVPLDVEEGEGESMEAVLRLLGELEVAVGEVGADAAAVVSAVAGSERRVQEAPALHNPAASVSSPALKQPSPEVEAAAAAGEAQAVDEAVVTMPMPAFVGRQPAGATTGRPTTGRTPGPVEPPPGLPLPPAGPPPAGPPPAGLPPAGPPPAGPPPASGTQASEDPVAAAGATQGQVPQREPAAAGAGLGARPFGLSVADVPRHSGGDYHWLHTQARAALNNLYATRLQEAVAPAFAWREYVCAHPASRDLVGPGIHSFVAEPIAGTRDANRRGHPRIDFVLQRVDGWVARLHPGRRPQQDAAVCWFPPGAFSQGGQASGVGAGMYVASAAQLAPAGGSAAQPAPAGGPPVLLTVEEAAAVPPADRMGKAAAYERMTWLRGWIVPSEEHGLIDVTHCAQFAWQTWVANVRHHVEAFIGPGICSVFVTPPEQPELQLRAHRCDGTWACLQLERTWQGQGWQHAVKFLGVHHLPGGPPS